MLTDVASSKLIEDVSTSSTVSLVSNTARANQSLTTVENKITKVKVFENWMFFNYRSKEKIKLLK
jgi:hypothetical protein